MKFDPRDQLLWDFGWEVNRVILKMSNGGWNTKERSGNKFHTPLYIQSIC